MSYNTASSSSKPTRTILDFFKPSPKGNKDDPQPMVTCPPVKKVSCPACCELVSEVRMNWHLDHDCPSRVVKKKRKRNKKVVRNSKKKRRTSDVKAQQANVPKKLPVVLSDSDVELCDEVSNPSKSPVLFDLSDNEIGSQSSNCSQNEVYISPFMLETQLYEDDEKKISASSPQIKVKTLSTLQTEEMLLNDWDEDNSHSPQKNDFENDELENKDPANHPQASNHGSKLNKPFSINSSGGSLTLNSNLPADMNMTVREDITTDVCDRKSSCETPRKRQNSSSSDDFMPPTQIFVKPENSPHSNKVDKSNFKNDSLESHIIESSSSNTIPKVGRRTFSLSCSPVSNLASTSCRNEQSLENFVEANDFSFNLDILTEELELPSLDVNDGCDSDSTDVYSPLASPRLLSPCRTPSPSPYKNLEPCQAAAGNSVSHYLSSNLTERSPLIDRSRDASEIKDPSPSSDAFRKLLHSPIKHVPTSESCNAVTVEMLHESHIKLSPSLKRNMSRFGLSQKSPRKLSPVKKPSLKSVGPKASSKCTEKTTVLGKDPSSTHDAAQDKDCSSLSPAKIVGNTKIDNSPKKLHLSQSIKNSSPSKTLNKSPAKKRTPQDFREHNGYYLDNFQTILDAVCSCPADYKLFNDEDRYILSSFASLSLAAKKLYVRLFQRKIEWKRVSKIEYQDICDTEDIILYIKELGYAKYLLIENELESPGVALALLTGEEVTALAKEMKVNVNGKNKTDLINTLLNNCKIQPTIAAAFSGTTGSTHATHLLLHRTKAVLGPCCCVSERVRRVLLRVFTLYSLPRYDEDDDSGQSHQLVTLLRVNLGQVKYPTNTVRIRQHDIFSTRDDLIQFEECQELYSAVKEHMENRCWQEAVDVTDRADALYQRLSSLPAVLNHDCELPRFLRRYTSLSLLVHVKAQRVEALQRLKKYKNAVKVLRELLAQTIHHQDWRGAWYDRLALNLDQHLKMHAEALEVVYEALRDPEVRVGHRLALSLRGQRLLAFFARHAAKTSKKRKHDDEDANDSNTRPSVGGIANLSSVPSDIEFIEPMEAPRVVIEGRCFEMDNSSGFRRVFLRGDSAVHSGEGDVMACSVEELTLGHYNDQGYCQGTET
ncbi:hypothetical protein FHG87_017895 [Trinorchestia longiramus]|nr:hypothetical protein FHG87_017895 [Trinorchestia longiramus]